MRFFTRLMRNLPNRSSAFLELPSLNLLPFQTGKGNYLYDTTFRNDKKAGRKRWKATGKKNKSKLLKIIGIGVAILYFYGMIVRSVSIGIQKVWQDSTKPFFTWNPFQNIGAVFFSVWTDDNTVYRYNLLPFYEKRIQSDFRVQNGAG